MEAQRLRVIFKLGLLVIFGLASPLWLGTNTASANTANTVAIPDAEGETGFFSSIELDADGNPVIGYRGPVSPSGGSGLKVLHCNDPFCLGEDESITAPHPDSAGGLWLSPELDTAGNPVMSYRRAGDPRGLEVMHCNDPNCSGDDESVTLPDTDEQAGRYTSLVLDASGNPVVSYHVRSLGPELRILHCNDPDCAGNDDSLTAPDSEGTFAISSSLELDLNGNPVLSYYGGGGASGLKLLHCNDVNCAGGDDDPVFLDNTGLSQTSLALDSSSIPVIAYWDEENDRLKVLHCGNSTCSAGNSIESPASGGQGVSLTLDAAGNPVISHGGSEGLVITHCNDPDCSGGDEKSTTLGVLGLATSLALDSGGVPVVSFWAGFEEQRLKVLRCSDEACSVDTDGDGCNDLGENGPDETRGGLRDNKNPWDFYDVNGDQIVDLSNDIFEVIQHYAPTGTEPEYDVNFDRGPSAGPDAWNMTAPDGVIDLTNDILGVIEQYLHSCQ